MFAMPRLRKQTSSLGLLCGGNDDDNLINENARPPLLGLTAKLRKRERKVPVAKHNDSETSSNSGSLILDLVKKTRFRPRICTSRSDLRKGIDAATTCSKPGLNPSQFLDTRPYLEDACAAKSSRSLQSRPVPIAAYSIPHGEAWASNAPRWTIKFQPESRMTRQGTTISNIDWNEVNEKQLGDILSAYRQPIFPKSNAVNNANRTSPLERPMYYGKGKAKAVVELQNLSKQAFEAELFGNDISLSEHFEVAREYPRCQHGDDADCDPIIGRETRDPWKGQVAETTHELRKLREDERERRQLEEAAKSERRKREEQDRIKAQELQDEEDRLAEELAKTKEVECICCGNAKAPDFFPIETPSAGCEHGVGTCIECTHTWLATELKANGVEALKCPECPRKLSHEEVKACASADTFAAYEKFLTRATLATMPNFTWCLKPGCASGQVNEDNENYMLCVTCGFQQCVKHRIPWHKRETCQAYEYRESGQKARDEERATEEMLNGVSKKCPGPNCGWRIQKIDGCDHMTCRQCQHQFCWQCLASHSEIKMVGNTAHASWCKFHTANLEVSWPFNMHR